MGRTSPQGLTTQDFHHQPFVNPLDVFPAKSRLASRSQTYRSPIRSQPSSSSPSRFPAETHKFACCDEEEGPSFRRASALNCCTSYDRAADGAVGYQQSPNSFSNCCDEPPHNSPSPMDCEDCVDDCDDCVEEHLKANIRPTQTYVDDCDECNEAEDIKCSIDPTCQDACDECDFSCFDCIDWNEFDRDKSLGLSFSVPLLGTNGVTEPTLHFDDSEMLTFPGIDISDMQPDMVAPPLDLPMHHQCFGNTVPYWNNIAQEQLCTGNPGLSQQLPLPPFVLGYGCHPATAHQQGPVPPFNTANSMDFTATPKPEPKPMTSTEPPKDALSTTSDLLLAVNAPSTSRACQWIMPCGTVCGASFATGTDLKKHLKALHLTKGVTKCNWQDCDSADFASEAALTGHISKKHLAPLLTTTSSTSTSSNKTSTQQHTHIHHEGPFKCTFPGCPKSFMYKQVRDDHVASCHNGNKMYCHICNTFLNGEGSNFKRHMATHRPKHQHMLCKFHGLGCKRRFPRLDNLRRHEACCKFGKKASLLAQEKGVGAGTNAVGNGDGDAKQHHHHHHQHQHQHQHHHVHGSKA